MLNINNEIEQLYQLLANAPIGDRRTGMFDRLYALGLLTEFNRVNQDLESLSSELDTTLKLDAVSIKFYVYLNSDLWYNTRLFEGRNKKWGINEDDSTFAKNQTEINRLTDYLPNGVNNYVFTPDMMESFKNAMHQLCDDEKTSCRNLIYALDKALNTTMQLLDEIAQKVKNPESHLYVKLWDDTLKTYNDDRYDREYLDWLEDMGTVSLEDLRARQKREIFNLLNTKFFRFLNPPTGSDVKKCRLKITEDDLEVGTEIPSNIDAECAKFEKFIEWKEDFILTLNYEKLGHYIYKNYHQFETGELFHITNFDKMMDLIHEEMARLKPSLAQYLKRYQEDQDEELLNDCKTIFAPFKNFLKTDIRQTLLDEYLEKLLFDSDLKEEAKKKLGGQSKNKYCCAIVIALSDCYIFQGQYKAEDFSKVLYTELNTINQTSFLRYLKIPETKNAALSKWTRAVIDNLKEHPYERQKEG